MTPRPVFVACAFAAALGAAAAFAQQPNTVARLVDLRGNVLVSQGDAQVAAVNEQRVAVGARVLTTTGAHVVIRYDTGCDVELKENQRFTVRVGECPALLAEVVPLGPAPGAIGGGLAASGISVEAVVGAAITGGGLYLVFRRPSVSAN